MWKLIAIVEFTPLDESSENIRISYNEEGTVQSLEDWLTKFSQDNVPWWKENYPVKDLVSLKVAIAPK